MLAFFCRNAARAAQTIASPLLPQFHFHLRTPAGLDPDDDGLALADLDTAYLEVCASIPDMAAEFARKGLSPLPYAFVIADAAGIPLMEVPFAERLNSLRKSARPGQLARARQLSGEIAEVIRAARETTERSREILARSRAS